MCEFYNKKVFFSRSIEGCVNFMPWLQVYCVNLVHAQLRSCSNKIKYIVKLNIWYSCTTICTVPIQISKCGENPDLLAGRTLCVLDKLVRATTTPFLLLHCYRTVAVQRKQLVTTLFVITWAPPCLLSLEHRTVCYHLLVASSVHLHLNSLALRPHFSRTGRSLIVWIITP